MLVYSLVCKGVVIAGTAAFGGLVAAPAVAPGLLAYVGFGALGPVAGTAAAGMQAAMGGTVAAGGWFAAAQSVAMGGALPTIGTGIAGGVSTVVGGALSSIC